VCHDKGKALMESIEKTILRRIFVPERQNVREVQLKVNSWTSQLLKKELCAFKTEGTDCPLTSVKMNFII
jgi:hypothetical protein